MVRRKRRKLSAFFGFFYLLLPMLFLFDMDTYAGSDINTYDLYATAAVLMDGDTGRVLFGKQEEEHMANASTTKILTCIVVLENASLDDYLCVSENAARQPDVQANLNVGEYYLVGDLLYSIMLESHNDSAYALAEYVGGSVEGFAELMNQKAKEIGCTNSYFITPNGLDATDENTGMSHGTTAKDLANIMRYCVKESPKKEQFLEITQKDAYSFSDYKHIGDSDDFERGNHYIACVNHNTLLHSMGGMISGKTGFTNRAGYCYVGAVVSEGRTFIIAVLGCGWPPNKTYKWADAKTLVGFGESNYELRNVKIGDVLLKDVPVFGGEPDENSFSKNGNMKLYCDVYEKKILLSENEKVTVFLDCPTQLDEEVFEHEKIGSIFYRIDDFDVETEPVYAQNSVHMKNDRWAVFSVWELFIKEFFLM